MLLLDEPASGLDPNARRDLADVLRQLGADGKAVLVSSHILSEMTDFCNSVGIMERGRMVVSGRVEDVLDELRPGRSFSLRLVQPDPRLGGLLEACPEATGVVVDGTLADFLFTGDDTAAAALLGALVQAGLPVIEFREEQHDLEDIFRQVSTGEVS